MRKITMMLVMALGMFAMVDSVSAKTIRAKDLTGDAWGELKNGATIEFRAGDQLPVTMTGTGDFLESAATTVSYVKVKRDFWLRIQRDHVELSLDGKDFRGIDELTKGSFEAGSDGRAIVLGFNWALK